jgi:hypothetical protein
MDIKNNRVGIEWGQRACRNLAGNFDERVMQAALTHLANRQLHTLRRGNTACATPEVLLRRGFEQNREKQKQVIQWMKDNNGICK